MGESRLAAYATVQVQATIDRLMADVTLTRKASQQDTDALVALLHNAEALSLVRAAKRLHDEMGCKEGRYAFLDIISDLKYEQEHLLDFSGAFDEQF